MGSLFSMFQRCSFTTYFAIKGSLLEKPPASPEEEKPPASPEEEKPPASPEEEDEIECVVCYITQKEITQQNIKDIVFIPCERCKKTICIECMNEMSKTNIGYFCPMCRFGHPDDKSSNNVASMGNIMIGPNAGNINFAGGVAIGYSAHPMGPNNIVIGNLENQRQRFAERRNAIVFNPEIPVFQQFLAAIRRNNYDEVCYYLDNDLVNPANQNSRAYALAMSSSDRRIIDRIGSDPRVDRMAFERSLNANPFNYNDYLSAEISRPANNIRAYNGGYNWESEYDLGRPYF